MNGITYLETFSTVLDIIESCREDKLSADMLSNAAFMSRPHLQRIFKQVTGQSMMAYARGRRLTRSLHELLGSDMRVIDIAARYGFAHEQSYIRMFHKEFGCTPGEARRRKLILPVRERISPDHLHDMERGILYGPEHVITPSFHMIGKPATFANFDGERDALLTNMHGQKAYYEVVANVKNAVNTNIYVAPTFKPCDGSGDIEYCPGVEVKDLSYIPQGLKGFTFPLLRCVCFRYVGHHPLEEISVLTASKTYGAKFDFFHGQDRYKINQNYHFERIQRLYNNEFCQMEIFIPVGD